MPIERITADNLRDMEHQEGLPRQYMHNKENAVTMRLSAH